MKTIPVELKPLIVGCLDLVRLEVRSRLDSYSEAFKLRNLEHQQLLRELRSVLADLYQLKADLAATIENVRFGLLDEDTFKDLLTN